MELGIKTDVKYGIEPIQVENDYKPYLEEMNKDENSEIVEDFTEAGTVEQTEQNEQVFNEVKEPDEVTVNYKQLLSILESAVKLKKKVSELENEVDFYKKMCKQAQKYELHDFLERLQIDE